MRIRMKVQMSGTRNGQPWPPVGEPVDLPAGEAQRLCASGIAKDIPDEEEVETATPPAPETSAPAPAEVSIPPEPVKRGRGRPRKSQDDEGTSPKE